jgi:UTP--glucose-1-phosphate uridylyltransferase
MPKEMLTLVDKPVIQYIVEEFVTAGIEEIVLITSSDKRAIEDHFDRSFELEYHLEHGGKTAALREVRRIANLAKFVYVRQQEMRGNGHALLQAEEILGDEPFALAFGDDLIKDGPGIGDLIRAYRKTAATQIGVTEVPPEKTPMYGIVKPRRRIRGKTFRVAGTVEKPPLGRAPSPYAIAGRYVFTPKIFDLLHTQKPSRSGEIWLSEAVGRLIRREPVCATVMSGQYFDCGNKLGFLEATVAYALAHREFAAPFRRFLKETAQ